MWFVGDHADVGGGWHHTPTSHWIPVSFVDNKCPALAFDSATGDLLPMTEQVDLPQWIRVEITPGKPSSSAKSRGIRFFVSTDHALSIITLNWMLEAAEREGIPLKDGWRLTPDSLRKLSQKGIIHVSKTVIGMVRRRCNSHRLCATGGAILRSRQAYFGAHT